MNVDSTTREVIQPTLQQLIDQYLGEFRGAIVNHITSQSQDYKRVLEDAEYDLEVLKKAYYKAERDMRDREVLFEREKQTLNDKIHELKEFETSERRVPISICGDGKIPLPCFVAEKKGLEQERRALSDETRQLMGRSMHAREERSEGAIVDHVTTQCQDQGQLLEEAQRDLGVFKKAYYRAEHEIHDLWKTFEQEKQVLNDEIRRLRERDMHDREERFEGAIVHHITTQCQCQGRLLEEAKRDLEVLKSAHYKAEHDMKNLEERFEREMQAANHEIRQLRAAVAHEKRAANHLVPSAAPADTRRYAAVWEGAKTA